MDTPRKFIIYSTYGEILDLAIHLERIEGHNVCMYIADESYKRIGDGLVTKIEEWWEKIGEGYTWVFDGCETAKLQDWLRSKGEAVFGTSEEAARWENDRQAGQGLFVRMGFDQPESHNFTDIDEAVSFVKENDDRRWILKQNGNAPKHLSHMGKFDGNEDMLYHLQELKKLWSESEYGPVDFDLMEAVEGCETAFSALWNGHDWARDAEGKAQGWINWEHKKSASGDMGRTCGESGTMFYGVDEDNDLFSDIMLNEELEDALRESGMRGVVDINGLFKDDGEYVAFEFTSRPGIPSSSYEFIEGMETETSAMIDSIAKNMDVPISVKKGWGGVLVFSSKPFPMESDNLDSKETSLDERLWPLENGRPIDEFTNEQLRHIHFYNVKYDEEENIYTIPTKSGYILTVTTTGESVAEVRETLMEYAKENVYLPDQQWIVDLGCRMEDWADENIS